MSGSQAVEAGHTKHFECQVIGNPLPNIKWFKDEDDITQNPRYCIKFYSTGVTTLLIDNITYEDQGCYKCKADNTQGSAYTTSYLVVKAPRKTKKSETESSEKVDVVSIVDQNNVTKSGEEIIYEESSSVYEESRSSKKKKTKKVVEVVESTTTYEETVDDDDDSQVRKVKKEITETKVTTNEEDEEAKLKSLEEKRRNEELEKEEQERKKREERERREEERKEEEEKQRLLKEKERIKNEEEERLRKEEEERIQKEEEERRQKEENKKRKEEERIKKENEEKSIQEEEEQRIKREKEEQLKLEEEERLKKEKLQQEEEKRKLEEEKRKKEEEEKLRLDEENRKKEEERKKELEEKQKVEEEKIEQTEVYEEEIEITEVSTEERPGQDDVYLNQEEMSDEEEIPEPEVAITVDSVAPPVMEVKPEPQVVNVGETVALKCVISGTPEPDIEWFKDGKVVKPKKSGRTSIHSSPEDGQYALEIAEVKKSDSGKYAITATNSEGKIFHEVDVLITKSKADKPMSDEIPPEFTVKPSNITVTEFDPVKIACSVTGSPSPTVTWFKDGKPLKSEYNVQIFDEDGNVYLEILKASLLDAGEYTCTANNSAGGTFCTFIITVEALTEVESSASTDVDKMVIKRLTPRITEEMDRISDAEAEREKEMLFKEYVVKEDFTDALTKVELMKDDIVEVMDMKKEEEWLVRKQAQKQQVCYVPVSLLQSKDAIDGAVTEDLEQVRAKVEQIVAAPEAGALSPDGLHSPPKVSSSPSPDRRRGKLSRSPSKRYNSTDKEDASSEDDEVSNKLEALPVYVAIADFIPTEDMQDCLRLKEGQFVDALDMNNPDNWLVRTKPSKTHPAKVGWVPPCYLEKKDGAGHVDRRTTREVFREDIIQITNKEQEAVIKRRYALTELLETERDYVKDLKHLMETIFPVFSRSDLPEPLKAKKQNIFGYLEEINDFHSGHFLPELMNCTNDPSRIGSVFMKWKDKFDLYIPQYENEKEAERLIETKDSKKFLKSVGDELGEEKISLLPRYLQKPLIRINKYIQLLKDFVRYSSRAGENCAELEAAIKMLMNIPRQASDILCLAHIEGCTADISELGPIIRGDDFLVWECEPLGRAKERRLLLFKDKLLLAKPKKHEAGLDDMDHVFKSIIDLRNVQINEQDLDDDRLFELWYVNPDCEKLIFQASTPHAKQAWVKDIRDALKGLGIEETDLSPEDRVKRKVVKSKTASPKKKTAPEPPAPEEIRRALQEETDGGPGATSADDYLTMDSYESDVSSVYHTAPEYEDGSSQPGFKQRLRKVTVEEGKTAVFKCTTGGSPKPTVAWLKDNEPITESEKYRFVKEGDVAMLEVTKATKEDCGIYAAVLTNKNGSVSCIAELDIGEDIYKSALFEATLVEAAEEQDPAAPSIETSFDDVETFEGQMATFQCKISGHPEPEITWFKDGKKITADGTHFNFLFPDDETFSLVINDVQPTDSGSVTCRATNKHGEVSVKAKLHVQDSPVSFVTPLTDHFVEEGADALFECEISRPKTETQVSWHRNAKRITPSDKFEIVCEGTRQKLIVHNVGASDKGEFSIRIGQQQNSGKLKVKETPLAFVSKIKEQTAVESSEVTFQCEISKKNADVCWTRNSRKLKASDKYEMIVDGKTHKLVIHNVTMEDAGRIGAEVGLENCSARLNVVEAPIGFSIKFEDQNIQEEEHLTLSCEVNKSGSRVVWSKDNERLWPDGRIDIKARGSTHNLIISGVRMDDTGEYSCRIGDESCTAKVTVREGSPKFKSKLSGSAVLECEEAVMRCELTKPNAAVSWLKNGEEIADGDKYRITMSGREHTLTIPKVSLEDAGEYVIRAGDNSSSFKLKVAEAPISFSSKLKEKTAYEGDDVTLVCETNKISRDVVWFRYGKKMFPDARTEIQTDGRKHSVLIRKVTLDDSARYSAKVGMETTSAKLTVDEVPLSFTTKLEDKNVVVNDSLTLTCEISRPHAGVTWYKDGLRLMYEPRYNIQSQGTQHTLTIDKLQLDDAGEFMVKIDNTVKSSAKVTVQAEPVEEKVVEKEPDVINQGKEEKEEEVEEEEEIAEEEVDADFEGEVITIQEPPLSFTAEVANVTAAKHEKVTFICEASNSNAKVTWYKDGKELQAGDKYEFRVAEKQHSLIICSVDADDEGEYVAKTQDGVATVAKLTVTEPRQNFAKQLTDQTIMEGGVATFSCEVVEANAKVVWCKNGTKIKPNKKYALSEKDKLFTLTIKDVTREDGGRYEAKVGENVMTAAVLNVQEPELNFAKKLEDQTITEGSVATLSCEVSKDNAAVVWCKDGADIKPNEKYSVVKKDKQCSLIINNVTTEDGGEYIAKIGEKQMSAAVIKVEGAKLCFASNISDQTIMAGGVATFSCEANKDNAIVVWCKDGREITPSKKYSVTEKDKQFSLVINDVTAEDGGKYLARIGDNISTAAVLTVEGPQLCFAKDISDQTIMEGGVATFSCETSRDKAGVSWCKDGKEITPNEKYSVVEKDKQFSLIINDVTAEDGGKYVAKIGGDVSTTAVLTVEEIPAKFLAELQDQTVLESDKAVLTCQTNKANVKVVWYKNNKKIKASDKYSISTDGADHSLSINDLKTDDAATYMVKAGDLSCEAKVEVKEAQTGFSVPLQDVDIKEEDNLTLKCEVIKTGPRAVWCRNDEQIWPDGRVEIKARGLSHTLLIPGVREEDTGEYSCRVADQMCKAKVSVQPGSPKFKAPLSSSPVMEGEEAMLKCELSKPNAAVQWFRNGEEIVPGEKYEATVTGKTHSLKIQDVCCDDSAEYTVKAGDNSSSCKLKVKEAPLSFTTKMKEQTVCEGDEFTLTCETNKATKEVTWHRYSKKIYEDDRTEIKSDGKTHTLCVKNATFDDSARYSAKVKDETASVKVTVDEAPVSFTKKLEDVTVAPDNSLTLTCEISKPYARVTWYKDGVRLSYDSRYEIKSRGKEHSLVFDKIKESDSGEYKIKAENDVTCSAKVRVAASMSFTKQLEKQSATEHQSATFVCETSKACPEVTWCKNGKEISPGKKYEMVSDGLVQRLTLRDVTMEDAGEFSLTIGDGVKSAADLVVQEEPVKFAAELQNQVVVEENTATLTCKVNKAKAKVAWYKNNKELKPSKKYQMKADGVDHTLTIKDICVEDAGTYTAKSEGVTCDAVLNVQEAPVKFLSEIQDQTAKEAGSVIIKCQVSKPTAKVTWYKNGKEVKPSDKVKVISDGAEQSLCVSDLTANDAGKYTAKCGDASCDATISIQELPVTFNMELSDQKITEGEDVTFSCSLSKSDADVTWMCDGKKIKASKTYQIQRDGATHTLVIRNVGRDQSAEYTLKTKDSSSSAKLTVEEKPVSVTIALSNQKVTEDQDVTFTCELSKAGSEVTWWKDNQPIKADAKHEIKQQGCKYIFIVHKVSLEDSADYSVKAGDANSTATLTVTEAPVTITTGLQDSTVTENESVTFTCELSKPGAKVTWFRYANQIKPSDKYVISEDGCQRTLQINNLSVSESAEYTVKVDDTSSTARLVVNEAPVTFTVQLQDQTVTEDEDLTLTCEVSKPEVKVIWMKDGKKIKSGDRYEMRSEGCVHMFMIRGLTMDDAAEYGAKVANEKTVAKIEVKVASAKFSSPLQNLDVIEDEDAVLTCQVSKPDAKVTWMQNGKVLEASERIEMREAGLERHLVIHNVTTEDGVEYTATIGEHSTSAVVNVEALDQPQAVTEEQIQAEDNEQVQQQVPNKVSETAEPKEEGQEIDSEEQDKKEKKKEKKKKENEAVTEEPITTEEAEKQESVKKPKKKKEKEELTEDVITPEGVPESQEPVKKHKKKKDKEEADQTPDGTTEEQEPVKKHKKKKDKEEAPADSVSPDRAGEDQQPVKKHKKKKDKEEIKAEESTSPETNGLDQESVKKPKKKKDREEIKAEDTISPESNGEDQESEKNKGADNMAPEITSNLKDTETIEGASAKFSCKIDAKAEVEITWLKDGQEITSNKNFKVKFDGSKCSLTVKETALEDAGMYMCRVASLHGSVETSAGLKVDKSEPRVEIPVFTKKISNIDAQTGEEGRFECQISGPADVTWHCKDLLVKESENIKISRDGERFSLVIRSCQETDQGVYICKATNTAGEETCFARLRVTAPHKPPTEEDLSSAYSPIFTKRLKDLEALEDDLVRFEVRVIGEPEPEIEWFKNGQPITFNDKFSAEQKEGKFTLILKDATQDDAGCYSCSVTNKAGTLSSEAQLVIESLTPSGPEEKYQRQESLRNMPPTMPLEKPEVTESEPDYLCIKWPSASYPAYAPSDLPFTYIIEKRELPKHDWIQIASGIKDNSYKITGFNTERDNLFRVRAENEYGVGEPSLSLTRYEDLPVEEEKEEDPDAHKTKMPPRLAHEKPSVAYHSPDSFTLSWKPAELPAYAKWTPIKYNIEMKDPYTQSWKVHKRDLEDSTFKFKNFPTDKDYCFRIRAINDFGKSEPSYSVLVTQEPEMDSSGGRRRESMTIEKPKALPRVPFEKPKIFGATEDRLRLSWQPATTPEYAQQSPITYILERKEHPGQAWTQIAHDLKDTEFTVIGLDKEKDYSFRIRAQNEAGTTDPSMPASHLKKIDWSKKIEAEIEKRRERRSSRERDLKPREVPEYMRIYPEFTGTDGGIQYAVEHKPAHIITNIKCYPEPNIMFFFKGDKIELGERHNSYLSPTGELRLEFDEMLKSDVGEYKIYIENQYGSASHMVQLEIADPPCFMDPLKDTTIYLRGNGNLECRVDGNPYPTISFKRDWRTLADSHRVKIRRIDYDQWTLQINNAIHMDDGQYECVAENIAGKIYCSAYIKVIEKAQFLSDVKFNSLYIEDHYHLLEEIGRGSRGVVRRAINKIAGSESAAKFLRVKDEAEKQELKQELETMKLLSHSNILEIQAGYESSNQLVIVSELLTGGPLFEQIVYEDNLTESEAAFYMRQLVDAVDFMHAKNVVHLDLKPENLFLTSPSADEIKVIDFGFARRFSAHQRYSVPAPYGTPEFVAPEVVKDGEASTAADLWSVGVICYILLSGGTSPFAADSDRDTLLKVKEGQWQFDEQEFAQISDDGKDFISGLLNADPSKRRTATECKEHIWMQQAYRRGLGTKISIDRLKEYNLQRKVKSKLRKVRRTVNIVTLTSLMQEVPMIEYPEENLELEDNMSESGGRFRRSCSVSSYTSSDYGSESDFGAAFEDEDTWYQWSTQYQQGPVDSVDTGMPSRMRKYSYMNGDDGSFDNEQTDRIFRRRMSRDRSSRERSRDIMELQREAAVDTSKKSPAVTRRAVKQLQLMVENLAGSAGYPPIFKDKLMDKAYNVGESVTLSCHVLAKPLPTVTWYRNEQPLSDGGRIRTTESNTGHYTLTVLSTKPHDFGVYKVVMRNRHGTAKSRARLLFGDHPGRPGRPHVTKVAATEVFLIWDEPEHDGNSPIASYRIDHRKRGEEQWFTSTYTIDECALVKKLQPNTIYRFRVTAINHFGFGPYSWGSVECKTKAKGSPKIDIDYQTKKILLRLRQATDQEHLEGGQSLSRCSSVADDDEEEVARTKIPAEEQETQLQQLAPDDFFDFGLLIWRGRFSIVRNCVNKTSKRQYVAKISPFDEDKREECLREYDILKRINHEHIVRMHEAYLARDFVVLVQEKLSGENVIRALSFKNKYTEQKVAQIVTQILDAIQFLHHRGIVYLNLQPDNVVTVSQRRHDVKLIDFGRACRVTSVEGEFVKMEGTPEFMAVEKVCSERVGVAADIWGVGVMAFIMLSGVSPFHGEDRNDTLSRIRNLKYDVSELYFNTTRQAVRFILQTLKKDPSTRLTLDECLDHRWLNLKESAVKRRKAAVFMTDRLRQFAEVYQAHRTTDSGTADAVIKAFGGDARTEEEDFRLSDDE